MNLTKRFGYILLSAVLTLLFLGSICEESLPPYADPGDVYSLRLQADTHDLMNIRRDINQITMGKGALGFSLVLKNEFDETLAAMSRDTLGEISIWWKDDPLVKRSIYITRYDENLTDEIQYDWTVSLDPGDSIHCATMWQFIRDDAGVNMWDHLGTIIKPDLARENAMTFQAQARIVLIDQTPAAWSDIVEFRIWFYQAP